jgi:hypothetical protein
MTLVLTPISAVSSFAKIYDFFVEIWEMLKKRWRVYRANRARAAVQSKSFWRRVNKTIDRVVRAACGCPKNFGWTMGYKVTPP